MEKAWDLKGLSEGLKAKGLDLAEEAAGILAVGVLEWAEESVKLSENKYDDLAIAILPSVKSEILKLIDRIDGEDDDGDGLPAAPAPAEPAE